MREAGLEEDNQGFGIGGRKIINLRCADDTHIAYEHSEQKIWKN